MSNSSSCTLPVALSAPADPLSKAERAYRALRERIRELSLPPGARLDLVDVARSAIRDARAPRESGRRHGAFSRRALTRFG